MISLCICFEITLRWIAALMKNQHWFRQWLGAVRQQAITWTNADQDQWRNTVSLGANELILWTPDILSTMYFAISCSNLSLSSPYSMQYCFPDSKDTRIDIDETSIPHVRVGSMFNQCRYEGLCYLGYIGRHYTNSACFVLFCFVLQYASNRPFEICILHVISFQNTSTDTRCLTERLLTYPFV